MSDDDENLEVNLDDDDDEVIQPSLKTHMHAVFAIIYIRLFVYIHMYAQTRIQTPYSFVCLLVCG